MATAMEELQRSLDRWRTWDGLVECIYESAELRRMSTMNEVKPTELLATSVTLHILTTLKDQNTTANATVASVACHLLPLSFYTSFSAHLRAVQ